MQCSTMCPIFSNPQNHLHLDTGDARILPTYRHHECPNIFQISLPSNNRGLKLGGKEFITVKYVPFYRVEGSQIERVVPRRASGIKMVGWPRWSTNESGCGGRPSGLMGCLPLLSSYCNRKSGRLWNVPSGTSLPELSQSPESCKMVVCVCFDTVGWAAKKGIWPVELSGAVLAWLLEWGVNDLHVVQLMPLPPPSFFLHYNPEWFRGSASVVPAYPGCPGKRPLNRCSSISRRSSYCYCYIMPCFWLLEAYMLLVVMLQLFGKSVSDGMTLYQQHVTVVRDCDAMVGFTHVNEIFETHQFIVSRTFEPDGCILYCWANRMIDNVYSVLLWKDNGSELFLFVLKNHQTSELCCL